MKISCIALDDEPVALEIIKAHAASVGFLDLQETFLSPSKALNRLQREAVDLLFLDINMPDISGIEIARKIAAKPKVVFTTAFADFALEGFELEVADYLLKPIKFDRFLQACTRVQKLLDGGATASKAQSLFVKDGYEWIKLNLEDLLYIEADDNYVIFHEGPRKIISRMTLGETEKKLPAGQFIRVNKSFIVNVFKIERIEKVSITICGKSIPLTSSYRKGFSDKFLM